MGVERPWQRILAQRLTALQQRRGHDDRGEGKRRSAIIMLIMAGVLGASALFLARTVTPAGGRAPGMPRAPAVVAAVDIGFGETITPDKVKLIDWPAQGLPKGSFSDIAALTSGGNIRAALRPIAANEIIIAAALSANGTRLSTTPLLRPQMRAMAIPVDQVSGVSGLVYPGDRVDVLMTRQPEEALAHAELVAQDVRVLAVGADMNVGKDKPEVVKAVTLEVSALQGQKLSLAMTTATLSLALRHFSDSARVRLESLQLSDLNDGTVTRLIRKPGSGPAQPGPKPPAPAPEAPRRGGVIVARGAEVSVQPVLR